MHVQAATIHHTEHANVIDVIGGNLPSAYVYISPPYLFTVVFVFFLLSNRL